MPMIKDVCKLIALILKKIAIESFLRPLKCARCVERSKVSKFLQKWLIISIPTRI